MQTITLHIQGMSCGHCLNAVSQALHAVPGAHVKSVQMGRADVEIADQSTSADLITAVANAGYSAIAAPQG